MNNFDLKILNCIVGHCFIYVLILPIRILGLISYNMG